MAKRFLNTEIWDKEKFNSAPMKIKLLTIFIFSKCDCIGVFKMSPVLISAYIGEPVTEQEIVSIPMDISKISHGVFWLEKFCKFQYGVLKNTCPPHRKYIELLKEVNLYERVLKGYCKGIDTLQEEEEEKEKEIRGSGGKFSKPSVDEILEYCKSRNNQVDPQIFFDFYEGKGWMVGKNKMKDWKACVRTWEKRTQDNPVDDKSCVVDRGQGVKFQTRNGKKVYLCQECYTAMRGQKWGHLSNSEIERAVERGKQAKPSGRSKAVDWREEVMV